eukprot:14759544-Alexandrium_andersonii.AAC.1
MLHVPTDVCSKPTGAWSAAITASKNLLPAAPRVRLASKGFAERKGNKSCAAALDSCRSSR